VLAFTTAAGAEPFYVWEQDREIWSRDEATGLERKISRSDNAWSPDWDGNFAVWIADWSWSADVMGAWLDDRAFGHARSIHVSTAISSDPRVSAVFDEPNVRHAVAWRETGGVWAQTLGLGQPVGSLVVPDYTGPFDLNGNILTWDFGSLELVDGSPPVPEPSTPVLLLIGMLCCGWHVNSRPVRPSKS
jgi:hypothetical protein